MNRPDWLADLVTCPTCRGPLNVADSGDARCAACGRDFPASAAGQLDLRLEPPTAPRVEEKPVTRTSRLIRRARRAPERRALSPFYHLMTGVECCYCGWTGRRFLPAGDARKANRLCPRCGSLERYRSLRLYLERYHAFGSRPMTMLEIASRGCFGDWCRTQPGVRYLSSDLMSPYATVLSDLSCMGLASGAFDLIVSSHVMEHVPDDRAAFAEIGRMLKPDGFALVIVPIKGEKTFEDPEARPEDYERLYGQFDHVRICGWDYPDRMAAAGLQVEAIDLFSLFSEADQRRHALGGDDRFVFRLARPVVSAGRRTTGDPQCAST